MKCEHLDCGNTEKVWLPYMVREHPKGLKSHPFCTRCGMVKNIGSDRAIGRGYFINAISRMEKHLKIPGSSVRMRLAVKDLEKIDDFDDEYSMTRCAQENIFIQIIKKYYRVPEGTIKQFL
ncbi:MAG TPA: hypothetical protein VIO58_01985 [Candidatus Methanoperedens sp.]